MVCRGEMTMSTEVQDSLLIRAATQDDVPRIWEIFRKAFRLEVPSELELRGYFERCPEGVIVAQVGGEIAGCSVAFIHDGRPHLYGTAVASEFRKHRGIGTKLVSHQLSTFQRLGYPEIDTYIGCSNLISIKTGEKHGFKHVRTVRNFFAYPRSSARLMLAPLGSDGALSMRGPNLRDRAKDVWGRVVEPRLERGRLRVAWFDDWQPVLDTALLELPEMPDCPHEVFREIMRNPAPTRKRTALVFEGPAPLAVIGLREKGRYWMPVMQGITPGCIAPARDGFLFPALRTLDVEVRITDCPSPPPTEARARNVTSVPVFAIDCHSDYEAYWRKTHYMETIRDGRKRTEGFAFEVDRPGSAALTITNWGQKWRDHPDEQTIVASDFIVAAEYWEKRGRWHSFLLLDGDVPVAGMTAWVDGDHLQLAASFRDPEYDRRDVGVRIQDLIVQWAAQHGFAKVGLGGYYSYYKAKWAPQDVDTWDFRICPLRQHIREQITWKAKAVPGKLWSLISRLPLRPGARRGASDEGQEVDSPAKRPEIERGQNDASHTPTAKTSR
jgi:ribosomal protein S18 acetylase RimI-like enzyme